MVPTMSGRSRAPRGKGPARRGRSRDLSAATTCADEQSRGQMRAGTCSSVTSSFRQPLPSRGPRALRFGQNQPAGCGIVVENLGVAAPVDGGLQLPLRVGFAEVLVEYV